MKVIQFLLQFTELGLYLEGGFLMVGISKLFIYTLKMGAKILLVNLEKHKIFIDICCPFMIQTFLINIFWQYN